MTRLHFSLGGLRLAVLAAAALALVPHSDAAPATATTVLFKRSCGDCDAAAYCEFGYPGTPAGSIACVSYSKGSRSLLRRYDANGEYGCLDGGTCGCGTAYLSSSTTIDSGACEALCDANNNCANFSWNSGNGSCKLYAGSECTKWSPETGAYLWYQKDRGACPNPEADGLANCAT
ncbi:hypothetical protein DFJ74DRAFT_488604 [Hyaloraphidium curvatum]|nr:hypothetical protein DFJ74DRAFT_488604 [Hyaloraphidium curvatum]